MFKLNEKNLLIFFLLLFMSSVGVVYFSMNEHAKQEANKRIETILDQHKALHSYVENIQKPVIYKLKSEGLLYDEFFDPKLLSFTYIARNIHQTYKEKKIKDNQESYSYKLASNNPRNPLNKAMPFEKEILDKFNSKEIKEYDAIVEEKSRKYYYKALPLSPNKLSCMKCHSTPDVAPQEMVKMYGDGGYGEKVGDIRAMISLKIPMTEIYKESTKQFFIITIMILVLLISFYILIVRITKQKRLLQDEMQKNIQKDAVIAQQSKMVALGEMIGNIAHQWRQPLSIMSTASSGIKLQKEMGVLTDKSLIETMDTITATAENMSKTIEDFRDFLQGDDSRIVFNLSEEIEKCLEIEDGIIKQNSINIIKSLDDAIYVNNLPHGLSQSVVNIINNAKDAMLNIKDEKNRLLFIETKQEEENISITFKDSGGGIAEDIIDKVFDPYFTTKHQSQGTGLGLHMTYQIVTENMHGKVSVSNINYTYNSKEYYGAIFTILLPNN